MKNYSAVAVLCACLLLCSFLPLKPSRQFKLKTVIIDAGHGGKDPGCHGKEAKEKHITLKVALELGNYIKKNLPDVKVVFTRTTDRFVELHDRANVANKNHADLFISIHCNANNTKTIAGTETYAMGLHTSDGNLDVAKRENSVILQETDHEEKYGGYDPKSPVSHILFANYQSAYLVNSLRMANNVETQFRDRVGRRSRGVKQAGFIVLWQSAMPSVLVEIGFLTNQQEEKYLNSEEGQSLIASGLYRAFKEYKEEMESYN